MQPSENIQSIAEEIQSLEAKGAKLTAAWAQFERGSTDDVRQVRELTAASLDRLTALSANLEEQLRQLDDGAERDRIEHAFHIVQELRQSRAANQSLLDQMLAGNSNRFFEYFRALAIKEQAAQTQSAELQNLLH